MDNPLNKTVSQMAEESTHDTERAEVFKDGAHRALAAVRAFLSVSSHVSDTIEIAELRQYINQIDC